MSGIGETDNTKSFTRRALFIGGVQIALLAGLGARLGWLQIAQGDLYKTLSENNRVNIKILPPPRGVIVDRFGAPLAVNNQNFRVVLVREQTDNIERSLRDLQKIIRIEDRDIRRVIKMVRRTSPFAPLEIKDNLTWDEVSAVEVNLPDLPGVFINVGENRAYPLGEATAHVVGYVGAVSESEMTEDPLLNMPGFKIGKSGIEKTKDIAMRGRAGIAEMEVNVKGREIRELKRRPPVSGARVSLTIDADLQSYVQQVLSREQSASAVVMDVHSGAVYALASYPSFDPNLFVQGIPQPLWMELSENPAKPITNKAVSGQYPPGSTYKMLTALAGLRSGKITPGRTSFCRGHYDLGKSRFHCWKKEGHGTVEVKQALAVSCDVFFYEAARDIGIDEIAKVSREFGLGSKLDFDLAEERPGLVPDRDWKLAHTGETWQLGETIVTSIGQGFLKSTPLQLAVMTARLVNGGKAVKPWLTNMVDDKPGHPTDPWPSMGINPQHLEIVRDGMRRVVNDKTGTAYASRIPEPQWAMGGKTGTSQVRRITKQQRAAGIKNETLPWNQRHHALFVGYAPLDNPKYACAVVVEHGVGGSKAAAPIAKEILREIQRRDPASTQPMVSVEAPKI